MSDRTTERPAAWNRRRFLRGLGGVTVGLPMLDVMRAREGRAQGAKRKVYSVFMLQANGVVQSWMKEPTEMFWPRALGPLSAQTMATTDADRATGELKDHAAKLIMVRDVNLPFPSNSCGHRSGGNQCLTAARLSTSPTGNKSLAMGESVDNRIARELTPGREPFAVYAGPKSGYNDDNLSFRGPLQIRAADNNPWTAYQRLVGLGAAAADPALAQKLVSRRRSVNDILRTQIKELLGRRDLSAADRQRLDLHFSSVRDMELGMIQLLGPMEVAALQGINGRHKDNDNREKITRMQIDLVAFALASDQARTATLQIGDGADSTQYTIDGVKAASFHQISHRVFSDGSTGAPIPDAVTLHHKIDRLHARHFKYLIERLSAYTLPEGGTLLDSSFAVWLNSLANGPPHGLKGVPYIIAGSAGGFLKTGQFVSAGGATNNKLFNTLITAAGVRKPAGDPVDDFGDPSLAKGLLTSIMA